MKPGSNVDYFFGTGEMAQRMREFPWERTAIGAPASWSQSLKAAVRIMLGSRFPMFVWWGDQLINLYNDAYIPILGQRHPRALGVPAATVWNEIWKVVGPQAQIVIRTGEATWNRELLLVMERNGYPEETYFTFSYSPIGEEDGSVTGLFCACTEDTDRVLGQRRLRMLRELTAKTLEAGNISDAAGLVMQALGSDPHDVPFAALYLREGADSVRLAGVAGIEAGSRGAPIVQRIDDESQWPLLQADASDSPELVADLHTRFGYLPGGEWQESPQSAMVLPLHYAEMEKPAGFLITGLSPLLALDDDYRGFLELVARNTTTALENARAYEAEKQRAEALAELDRAKTAFFSNVSHEFRTPLTLLLGPLGEVLHEETTEPEHHRKEMLAIAHRNAMRLQKLVDTLLDFSRLEAGRMDASYEAVDLAKLTSELGGIFRGTIERAGLRFILECTPPGGVVYVDPEMWEKIVFNLLSNALKFTVQGEIAVILDTLDGKARLRVRDTGVGIPARELPHIFERFHRVEDRRGRTHEGTGIGLALTRELVHMHGGSISVQSTDGNGSEFTVVIPYGTAHLPADRIRTGSASGSSRPRGEKEIVEILPWLPRELQQETSAGTGVQQDDRPDIGTLPGIEKPRIVLADDNPDMRDYLSRLLSPHYLVEAVRDGVAALEAVRRTKPDLVLSDVMMPRLDGFGLLRELRSDPDTSALPIVLLSARAGEEAKIEGLQAGADAYLVKPFSVRELLATVNAHIEIARLHERAAKRETTLQLQVTEARRDAEVILESITDAFYALDSEWRYTYVNRQCEIYYGRPREELLGNVLWEVFPVAQGSVFEEQYRKAVQQQIAVHFEVRSPLNGQWLEVHAYPSPDRLAVYFRDISERKLVERNERFLASFDRSIRYVGSPEEVLDTVIRTAGDYFAVSRCCYGEIDQAQEYVTVNQDFCRGVESIAGRHHMESFGPDILRLLKRGETLAIADIGEDSRTSGAQMLAAFDAIEARAVLAVPLIKVDRFVAMFVLHHRSPRRWSAHDIALAEQIADRTWLALEASRNAKALREEEERLRLAARATNDAIWDWDLQTGKIQWNDAVTDLFGYPLSVVNADDGWWADHLHPKESDRVRASLYAVIDGAGENWIEEYRFQRSDGTYSTLR